MISGTTNKDGRVSLSGEVAGVQQVYEYESGKYRTYYYTYIIDEVH